MGAALSTTAAAELTSDIEAPSRPSVLAGKTGVCVVMMSYRDTGIIEAIMSEQLYEHTGGIVRFVKDKPAEENSSHGTYWYKDITTLRSACRPHRDELVVTFEDVAWDREFMLSDLFMYLLKMAKTWNILVIIGINDHLQMAPESRDHVNMRFQYDEEQRDWMFQAAPSALRRSRQISTFR